MSLLDRVVALWKQEHPTDLPAVRGLSRRGFLKLLGASTAIAAAMPLVDLEQLLWVPGQTIVVPEYGLVTPAWVTMEALRILEKNLAFPSMMNREYAAGFSGAAVLGQTVRIRRPRQIKVVTDQRTIFAEPVDPKTSRKDYRARVIEPAMQVLARDVTDHGITPIGVPASVPGADESGIAYNEKTGVGLRYVQGYSNWDDQVFARFDLMGTRC